MGKVRKRKPKAHKALYSEPAHNSDEEELPVDSKENVIQTIIDQLQVKTILFNTIHVIRTPKHTRSIQS